MCSSNNSGSHNTSSSKMLSRINWLVFVLLSIEKRIADNRYFSYIDPRCPKPTTTERPFRIIPECGPNQILTSDGDCICERGLVPDQNGRCVPQSRTTTQGNCHSLNSKLNITFLNSTNILQVQHTYRQFLASPLSFLIHVLANAYVSHL